MTSMTSSSRRGQRAALRRFTMLELVTAMVVLAVILSTVASSFSMLQRMRRRFAQEAACVLVLNNVVERLAAENRPSVATAQTLLEYELAAADVPEKDTLHVLCERREGRYFLGVGRANGKAVVSVELPLAPVLPR